MEYLLGTLGHAEILDLWSRFDDSSDADIPIAVSQAQVVRYLYSSSETDIFTTMALAQFVRDFNFLRFIGD